MTDLAYLLTGDADERVTWQGHSTSGGRAVYGSRRSIAHLEATNQAALEEHGTEVVVIQSAYNTGVEASAGTHDYDAVYDVYLPGVDWRAAQRFLREQGWAAWFREPPAFSEHIHMVSLGYRTQVGVYVPGQVADYYAHRNGLAGHALDESWHPSDIDATVFDYPAWKAAQDMFSDNDRATLTNLSRAVADLAAAEKQRAKDAADREARRFANLRVILKERFGATDADLDEIIGHLEP